MKDADYVYDTKLYRKWKKAIRVSPRAFMFLLLRVPREHQDSSGEWKDTAIKHYIPFDGTIRFKVADVPIPPKIPIRYCKVCGHKGMMLADSPGNIYWSCVNINCKECAPCFLFPELEMI